MQYTYRGAYLNALGEMIVTGLGTDSALSVDTADVPLQRLVLSVGGHRGAAHHCLARGRPGAHLAADRPRGRHPLYGAPTVLTVVNHPARTPGGTGDGDGGRRAAVADADRPDERARRRVVHVYGLTETYGPYTVCLEPQLARPPREQRAKSARQGGYAIADPVRVVDEQMRDVPPDGQTMGEVVMRGNNVMKGYFDDEAATAGVRGGWFHTGDLGVMHPDGYIELRDRGKDIIISGGENISTIEVEQTLVAHPAVLECAVIAIPTITGASRRRPSSLSCGRGLGGDEVIAFCRERLAHFKAPRGQFGELPKTSTGKVQKFVLREREWADQDTQLGGV